MGLLDALRSNGQSFAQGASNAIASNISAPVDGLAWLLRKGGLPIPDNPVGGSDWMAQRGLTAEPTNKLAGLLGEAAGGVGPMLVGAYAPKVANGLLKMGENAAAPKTLNSQTGAVVWHGSPHKFDAFDSSKIGTGEGAQAYGHGLYLAENPEVAGQYAKMNPASSVRVLPNGNQFDVVAVHDSGPLREVGTFGSKAEAQKIASEYTGANTYKVDLPDEHIAKMLDWDKPLSQQSHVMELINKQESKRTQSVLDQRMQTLANVGQNAPNASVLKRQIDLLREEVANPQESGLGAMTGGEYYNYLRRRDVAPAVQADIFKQAGIPGIRYLDGGSRGAGAGSSNFVVFPGNENLLQILERNGQPVNSLLGK